MLTHNAEEAAADTSMLMCSLQWLGDGQMDECSFIASCVSVRVYVCVCIPMPGITLIGCWCQSGHLVCGLSQEKEREQTLYSLAKVVNGADPTTDTALVVGRLYVTIIKCTKGEKDKKHSEYILRLKKCQIRFVPQCLHLFPESSCGVCVFEVVYFQVA